MAIGSVTVGAEVVAVVKGWPLLSEAADRYRGGHPVVACSVIIYFAGHLMRVWPRRFDPLTRFAGWVRR